MSLKIRRALPIVVLIQVLIIGNILAYFTDKDTVTNEFTTGRISIDLQEPNWDSGQGGELVPGYEIPKDPQVLNDGINDAFVFVTVEVPYQNVTTTDKEGNKLQPADTELFSYDVKDEWAQVGEPDIDTENNIVKYVYAYSKGNEMTTLTPNDTTPTVFDYIRFEGVVEDEGLEELKLDVAVKAYGIQTDNLDGGKTSPEDVWQIVSNARGSESNADEEDGMNEYGFYFGKAYSYYASAPKSVSTTSTYDVQTFIWHKNGHTEMYSYDGYIGEELSTYTKNEITIMEETGTVSSDGTKVAFGYRTYELNEDFIYEEDEYYTYRDDRDYSGGWKVEAKDKTLSSYGEIPSEVNGIPVTNLSYCFRDCKNMTISPKIPENVKDMESTFDGCILLANAPEIPDGVTNMDSTFFGCTSLIEAPEIPNGVTSMSHTFYDCALLIDAPEIPDGVTNMDSAFCGCTSLVNAPEIPDSVTSVYRTFYGCKSLIEAPEIPDGVTSMEYTFYGCKSLIEAPEIPDSVEDIDYTFYDCTSLINAPEIPDNVGYEMRETFANCTSLVTAPTIPDGVQELVRTFSGCTSLVNAPKIPNTVRFLTSTFSGCTSLVNSPTIPSSVNYMTGVFSGCTSLTGNVEINASKVNSYSNCFKDTIKPIKITGSCPKTAKANLASTANNGNVTY